MSKKVACPLCGGSGKISKATNLIDFVKNGATLRIAPPAPCTKCKGKGTVEKN